MKGLLLMFAGLAVAGANAADHPPAPLAPGSTLYFDGMPPTRYQGNARVVIHTVDDLNKHCGTPPPGKYWKGCVRGVTVFMPNPCPLAAQEYARILCHEFGHLRGWPHTHGE